MTKESIIREILLMFLTKCNWGTPERQGNYLDTHIAFFLKMAENRNMSIHDLRDMQRKLKRKRMTREEVAQARAIIDESLGSYSSTVVIRRATSKFWIIVGKIWLAMGGQNGDDSGVGGGGVRG